MKNNWKLKYYHGREIKTVEDIEWVCNQLREACKTGQVSLKEMATLAYLQNLYQEYIDKNHIDYIKSRFEILDL